LLLLRPSDNTILTVHIPKGGAGGTRHVLRLLSLPLREATSIAEKFAPFTVNEETLLELCWDELFEVENEKRQRAERFDLNNGCIRLNNVHAVAFKVTTVLPAKEARVGVTAVIKGGGPNSVIGAG